MSTSKESGTENGGGGGGKKGFQKLGTFWSKYILRKKPKKDGTDSENTPTMTSEEKNKYAADVATSSLGGLDKKTREQIAKALAAEMQRRHEERERRRRELMEATQVRLPWGKKQPYTKLSPSTSQTSSPSTSAPSPKQAATKSRGPSPGASVFPIKMVMKKAVNKPKTGGQMSPAVAADLEDEPEWRPVSAVGPSLEDQRAAWMAKSLKSGSDKGYIKLSPSSRPPPSSAMLAGPPTSSGVGSSAAQMSGQPPPMVEQFGSQPQAIQMDEETVKEIHSHTFGKMLENILLEAQQKQQKPTKSKKQKAKPAAAKKKDPTNMSADELVDLLQRDPTAWDMLTRQNTVISFGVVSPTDDDMERAKKTAQKQRAPRVTFDDETDVARAPCGRDFKFNEKLDKSKGTLKK